MKEERELIREIRGRRTAFMFIGRTAPPTRGHVLSFLRMIELRNNIREIVGQDIPIMINLSPTSPKKIKTSATKFEDPLDCEQKLKYIHLMLSKLGKTENIYPICIDDSSNNFRGEQLAHFIMEHSLELDLVVVFVGRDRFDETKGDPMKSYTIIARDAHVRSLRTVPEINVFVLSREDATTDPTAGKAIRRIIMNHSQEDAVERLQPLYTLGDTQLLEEDELKELWSDVRAGMETGTSALASTKSKKKGKGKKTKRKINRKR
jgi:hypothetical protein